MVWAIDLHNFLHCLDHKHLSLTTAGMSTTCHAGHVATVESRLSSPRPAPGTGESRKKSRLAPVEPARHAQPRRRPQTCRCMITGTFTTAKHLRHHHDLHNRDIGHLKERCNCGTSAVFCTLKHGHMSLNTTGMSTTLSKNEYDACNCGILAVLTQTAHVEPARHAQPRRQPPYQ